MFDVFTKILLSHGFLSVLLRHYNAGQGNFLPQVLHLRHHGRRASWTPSIYAISGIVSNASTRCH